MKMDLMGVELELPEGVKFSYEDGIIKAEGPKGSAQKKLLDPRINVVIENNKIKIFAKNASKKEKKMIGSFKAHIANIIEGVQNEFVYKLKICSGHFPMSVSAKDGKFAVKNFIGERVPRVLKLKDGAEVKIEGDVVVVSSTNKEIAGQVAADIEQLTRRPGYDTRIFQDGIYITDKAGKEIK